MVWESNVDKSQFLSADERILLALYLVNQEKSIFWLRGWLAPEYKGKNVYSTLSRLKRRQLVDRIGEIGEIGGGKYRLTQLGMAWLGRRFPLVVKEGSGGEGSGGAERLEGKMGMPAVVIDAAEVKGRRRKLVFDELKRWRYGRLARGVYVTGSAAAQAAVAEFGSQYRLGGYVNLMTIQPAEDPKIVADRIFRLKERNSQWRLLIDRIGEWQRIGDSPGRRGGTITGLLRIREDFLQLLVTEPGLPPELVPADYWMEEAIGKITNF